VRLAELGSGTMLQVRTRGLQRWCRGIEVMRHATCQSVCIVC
jgi:hypothetical protein